MAFPLHFGGSVTEKSNREKGGNMNQSFIVFLGLVVFLVPVSGKAENVDLSSKCTQKNQGGLGTEDIPNLAEL